MFLHGSKNIYLVYRDIEFKSSIINCNINLVIIFLVRRAPNQILSPHKKEKLMPQEPTNNEITFNNI